VKRRYSHSRFVAFAVLLALVMSTLLLRLVWIQIVCQEKWQQEAQEQSSQRVEVLPRRGAILDRNHHPLAFSERRARVGVTDPALWRQPDRLALLSQWLHVDPRRLRERLRGREGHVVLCRDVALTPVQTEALRREPTITLDSYTVRTYPMGNLATRLLGRVDERGHGDAGIEQFRDDILAGSPGTMLERYAGGVHRDPIMRIPQVVPVDGSDLVLTLDYRVQMILEAELERAREEAGARDALGIVLEPNTGEVIALAEAPLLGEGDRASLAPEDWRCRSITDVFEPGSTFKLFTVAALLAHGVCDTATVFDGEGRPGMYRSAAEVSGATIHDVHPVGRVSLRHAFVVSSNIVMAKASSSTLRAGEVYDSLRSFGFGSRTGCGLPAETTGLLQPPASWSRRTQPTLAIGQEIGVSLVQMAAGFAALVTDGTLRTPRLVRTWYDRGGRPCSPPSNVTRRGVVPPTLLPVLRELCRAVVNEPYGTGTRARVEGLSMAGKTGTAQISTPHGYVEGEFTASFVGFAPADAPRLLAAIVLRGAKHSMRWGGESAAPCFARVMRKVLVSTDWLDAGALATDDVAGDFELPDLRGEPAPAVLALARSGCWVPVPDPPGGRWRVVGQMPPPGTVVSRGARVQLAWAGGRP
jgi:cell division protein FtsI/penicillin-binding protein 2